MCCWQIHRLELLAGFSSLDEHHCTTNLRLTPRDWEIHSKSSTSSGFTLGRSSESDSIDCTTCLSHPITELGCRAISLVKRLSARTAALFTSKYQEITCKMSFSFCAQRKQPEKHGQKMRQGAPSRKKNDGDGITRSRKQWIKLLEVMLSSPPFGHHH